jgi:hypothetical protein
VSLFVGTWQHGAWDGDVIVALVGSDEYFTHR